jgi:hypothetical protein
MLRSVLNSSPTSYAARNKMAWKGCTSFQSQDRAGQDSDEVITHEQLRHRAKSEINADVESDLCAVLHSEAECGRPARLDMVGSELLHFGGG